MINISEYDYDLPQELIAQEPVSRRDASRLLVADRQDGSLRHHQFRDLPDLLREGDLLVFNDTKVMKARLFGRRATGGRVEILLTRPVEEEGRCYEALIKPLGRLKDGERIELEGGYVARLADARRKIVRFEGVRAQEAMTKVGKLPLPPYIRRPATRRDENRYQTVFARVPGAVAAPTAGLHFTTALVKRLKAKGVIVAPLTLHVGYATFAPVREDISSHRMGEEFFEISRQTMGQICQAKKQRRRVIAVGTTVCRTLEHNAGQIISGRRASLRGGTRLFIHPPFTFRVVDGLITNFHLPRTTLLLLVAAFAGHDLLRKAYQAAVEQRYRFYSYGDAMMIL